MPASQCELKVKLELSDDQLQLLRANPLTKADAGGTTQTLRATYFDTADRRLRAKGMSLCVQRVGKRWLQTVRMRPRSGNGGARATETASRVTSAQPELAAIGDKAVRRELRAAVRKAALTPIFNTVIQRTTQAIDLADSDQARIAIDHGTIVAGDRTSAISGVEIDLVSARPAALIGLAATLVGDGPLRACAVSLPEQGYRLVEPVAVPPSRPCKAEPAALTADQTGLEAFGACVRSASDQIVHNWRVVVDSDDPEGPHQLRVGLRRLRTALRMFRPLATSEELRALNAKLRNLARLIGEIRDLDVLTHEIVKPLSDRVGADRGLRSLLATLDSESLRWRNEIRAVLAGRDRSLDLLEISLLSECLGGQLGRDCRRKLRRPIDKLATRMIARSWRALAERGRRLEALDISERHEMRKDLKKLRYTVDFLAPLFAPREVRAFLQEAARMQDVFGYLNDVQLAQRLPEIQAVVETGDVAVQRAVGVAIGWHQTRAEHAWHDARSGWERLQRCHRFWVA